jgi:hypothetical protein
MQPPSINNEYTLPTSFIRIEILLIIIGFIFPGNLQAQISKQFKIKAGEVASAVIPFQERYRFPEFREGQVIYTNGTSATVKLNYNLLIGEMQFIDPKGDTSTLVNEYALKRVQLGQALFYNDYRQGYFEVIVSYPVIKLASNQVMQREGSENAGDNGYGISAGPTTSVASVRSPNTSQTMPTDVVLNKEVSYFVIDQNDRIYKASKATFLKIGKKHRKVIAKYLEDESIDFNKEADLRKLVEFFSQLS